MSAHHLQILDGYEVIGRPVVGPTGITYVPWIDEAVRPYRITKVPAGQPSGLSGALRRAA